MREASTGVIAQLSYLSLILPWEETCLVTQFRAFAKRLNLAVTDVEMASNFRWAARQIGSAPYERFPLASILM